MIWKIINHVFRNYGEQNDRVSAAQLFAGLMPILKAERW